MDEFLLALRNAVVTASVELPIELRTELLMDDHFQAALDGLDPDMGINYSAREAFLAFEDAMDLIRAQRDIAAKSKRSHD